MRYIVLIMYTGVKIEKFAFYPSKYSYFGKNSYLFGKNHFTISYNDDKFCHNLEIY